MRLGAAVAAGLVLLAGTAGCSHDTPAAQSGCDAYAGYLGHAGTSVSMFSSIRGLGVQQAEQSWAEFEDCTGISIRFEGTDEFEAELRKRVEKGTPPDVAILPQPGMLSDLARAGAVKPASDQVKANVSKWFSPDWSRYGTVDDVLYAAPYTANVKSFVWYSPKLFSARGYAVPNTWAEMIALSDRIAADGMKPWCVGIESGAATGWPATDWLEDVMLREFGADVYDQWVGHKIPFDDRRVAQALDRVGQIVRNPAYVQGGVKSIVTTGFKEAGLPVLERKCAMYRQASFYADEWPKSATIAPDGDIFAFALPPVDPAKGRQLLVAGEFVGAFTERPEVQAVTAYLSTPDWANERARIGGAVSANKGFDPANAQTSVEKLSAGLLTDASVTVRFDGSDLMPAAVGAGTFWTGMTEWVKGADTEKTLHHIETTWPR
ncbi:ABC transporter substrate-binding protein [Actinoplanes sp. NPDC049548]|uniref:ABC transporter substrate-binding protein n=1 Tax=Actinoplanes sp. NPDC049548 TaxID=3155152 RepID=UPI00343097B6